MNIGQLKEYIKDLPDDMEVFTGGTEGYEKLFEIKSCTYYKGTSGYIPNYMVDKEENGNLGLFFI